MYRDKKDIERRDLPHAEVRLADNNDSPKVVGYAARFIEWTNIGGMFKESIAPGSFKKTLKEADVRALVEHDPMAVIGRNKAGTLRLTEDDKGLAVEIDVPDTTVGRDLLISLRRGDKSQMSFGFTVNKADDDYEENTRVLRDVSLFDVSVVTYPAYPTTTAQVRSAFEKEEPMEDKFEELDNVIRKIKAEDELVEDDFKVLRSYLPLSEPAASHSETEKEPAASHSSEDTREADKTKMLLAKD